MSDDLEPGALPSLDEIVEETARQEAATASLARWNQILALSEALPLTLGAAVLQGLVDAANAYSGPIAVLARKGAEQALAKVSARS